MPFFGSKKSEKKEKSTEEVSYPRQQTTQAPHVVHHPVYPPGTFVYQTEQCHYNPVAPTLAFPRNDLPGHNANFCEGFLDGPDFSNRVPDRNIPPAPGSYYFYSNGSYPGAGPSGPPPMAPNTANSAPPPSYDEAVSSEMNKNKKKM